MPHPDRAEREAADDALVTRFVDEVMPGSAVTPLVPRNGPPPDYLVGRAGGDIGLELTEVLPERVPDDLPVVTVTGARRAGDPKKGSKALHQNGIHRQVETAAEAAFTGPPARVTPQWSLWKEVSDADVARLATALTTVVAQATAQESAGEARLEWHHLKATPLNGYIDELLVEWGGPIREPMWDAGGFACEVSSDAIQRTIASKELKFHDWRPIPMTARWLLLTLTLAGERLLESAAQVDYASTFDAVYCVDGVRGLTRRLITPRASPGGAA